MNKRFSFCLGGLIMVSFALGGCQKNVSSSENSDSIFSSASGTSADSSSSSPLPSTGSMLFENGTSPYTIVLPAQPTSKEIFARDELVTFFKKATGYTLPSVSDDGLSYSADACYISLGNTRLAQDVAFAPKRSELTNDGYQILNKGKSVFIAGPGEKGTLYGVYRFLNASINYRAYSDDEIDYTAETAIPLYTFNLEDKPAFEQRALGHYYTTQSEIYRDRLMVDIHGESWIYGSHSHFTILPPATYAKEHPDWYSSDMTQLNLSNEEMRQQFVANLKVIIAAHPSDQYILLGEEDHNTFCDCAKCQELLAKYKTPSAVDLLFVNAVADDIKAWLAETEPGRDLKIGTFAYLKTWDAPVHQENGKWVINDEILRAHDNVFVFLAPLQSDFSHFFHDEANYSAVGKALDGWKKVTEQSAIWTYSVNYLSYFTPFNNFGSLSTQMKEFQNLGALSVIDLGAWDTATPWFDKMTIYIQSRLLWNNALSYDALADDFMRHYYKDAFSYVRQYYDLERSHMSYLQSKYGVAGTCYIDMRRSDYYPKAYLLECANLLDEAEKAVSALKESDPSLYESLTNRVEALYGGILFQLIGLYQSDYTPAEQTALLDRFETIANRNSYLYWHEHTNLTLGDDGSVKDWITNHRASIV
jgi:hypothetical protein